MSNIDKQALRDSAESTINILENIAGFQPSDIDCDTVELRFETEDGFDTGCDVSIVDQCQKAADVVRALLDELEKMQAQSSKWCEAFHKAVSVGARYEERIAELEATQGKPVMFIDGDISPADAEKLAAVIREFNEETETPAARMARIIRENPHPTNMCDMPVAAAGKGEAS